MGVFLTKDELLDSYAEAEQHSDKLYKPFDEYERLAGNKISKLISKNMPKVNDGSLAALLLEIPMTVIPAMVTGKFTSTNKKQPWADELVNMMWENEIVPNANTQADFYDKELIASYRSLKYGVQWKYNFFRSDENYTGSDWSIPYVKNVKLEPGKYSIEDSDYVFMDVFFTKLQLKKIIEQLKTANKEAKAEGGKSDTSWNIDALKKLVDMAKTYKETKDMNSAEREKQVQSSGIKTTICFNRGKDAPFYMFSKHLPAGELLREWKNPDPTGDLPITAEYCYETLETPVGMGLIELAGGTQNVLDYMTQAHVLATQLGLQPPKKLTGPMETANLDSIVNAPDALWMLGNAQVDVVQPTSSVYSQFPNNYGLYKSQLQNLMGRTDGTVSSQSGNPMFSKTPQGIKQQMERTNAQDNYLRNKHDTSSSKLYTKMMNVHLAMKEGADLLAVAEDDKERLEKAGYFNENPNDDIPSITEIPFLYEELRDTYKFKYDPRPETDEEEKGRWIELIDIYASNPNLAPMLQQSGWDFNLGEAFKKVIAASGASDWEKVLVKIDPEQMQQGMGQMGTGGMQGQEVTQDPQLQQIMQEFGVNEQIAGVMLNGMNQGYDPQQILDYIMNGDQSKPQEEVPVA